MDEADNPAIMALTAEITSAYLSNNAVRAADVPGLLASIHEALSALGQPKAAPVAAEPPKPAVPIKKSITDEFIISLEDGRKLKAMKRYLAGLGMTPSDYRQKWGLPADYPMVAPAYAAKRAELARSIGLGRKVKVDDAVAEPADALAKQGRAEAA